MARQSAVPAHGIDQRALKILHASYWSVSGWKREGERQPSAEDFAYAKSKGVMFDPAPAGHAQVVSRLHAAVRQLDRRKVADAFLASLSTRRLELRSALGSFAVFQQMPNHLAVEPAQCACCGLYPDSKARDFSVLNFERFKWGGVRHADPVYAMFDLEQFLASGAPPPTAEDLCLLRELIALLDGLAPGVTSAALQGRIGSLLKSNKAERDTLVGILGYCGILRTPGYHDFTDAFQPFHDRPLPDRHFVDMPYPAAWWRSEYGIDHDRLHLYFGHVLERVASRGINNDHS